jgi:hypothetical protein
MLFEPLAEYMEENVGSVALKRGVNLFINAMPGSTVELAFAVMLKNTYVGIGIDPEIGPLRKGKISLVVRGRDHRQVKSLIYDIMRVLTLDGKALSDGVTVRSIRPITEPLMYPVSISNSTEMSVNLSVIYVIVAQ